LLAQLHPQQLQQLDAHTLIENTTLIIVIQLIIVTHTPPMGDCLDAAVGLTGSENPTGPTF